MTYNELMTQYRQAAAARQYWYSRWYAQIHIAPMSSIESVCFARFEYYKSIESELHDAIDSRRYRPFLGYARNFKGQFVSATYKPSRYAYRNRYNRYS